MSRGSGNRVIPLAKVSLTSETGQLTLASSSRVFCAWKTTTEVGEGGFTLKN